MRSYLQKGGLLVEELTFDPGGRLIQEMRYHTNTGKLLWTHNFEYDAEGRLSKATSSGDFVKTTGTVSTFTYDGQGNKTSEIRLNADGKVMRKSIFTYDNQGHLLTRATSSPNAETGKETAGPREEHRYDDHGNEIAWTFGFKPKDTRTWTTAYTYYPDGKIQRQEMDHGKGSHSVKEFSPEGWPIEELYVPLVTPEYRTGDYRHQRFTHNDAGKVNEVTDYDENDRLIARMEHD